MIPYKVFEEIQRFPPIVNVCGQLVPKFISQNYVCLSPCLSVYLSIFVSVSLSVCLCVRSSVCQTVCVSPLSPDVF